MAKIGNNTRNAKENTDFLENLNLKWRFMNVKRGFEMQKCGFISRWVGTGGGE